MVQNLKKLRQKFGVSQKALAESIGVSQQSINKYENHSIEPDISSLIAMADYFSTSVDYLVGHTEIDRRIEPVEKYDLNAAEAQLIDSYRRFNKTEKQMLALLIENSRAKK